MTFPFPFIPPLQSTIKFIGVTSLISTATAVSWPSDTQSGDFAIAVGAGNSAFSISGWTTLGGDILNNSPSQSTFAYKVLTAADITTPPTITVPTNGAFYILVYRGCILAAKRSTTASSTASVTTPGFTKSPHSRYILAVAQDRDPTDALSTPPTGFTLRASGISTYFSYGISDLAAADYSEGSVTAALWATSYGGRLTLLELIGPYTALLLHGNNEGGSTTIIDSAYAHRTMTNVNGVQISTGQSVFGGASMLFNGTNQYCYAADSDDWDLGTGDFTIDFRMRVTSFSATMSIINNYLGPSSGWAVKLRNSGTTLVFSWGDTILASRSVSLSLNTWYHVALVRTSGVLSFYLNGTQIGTPTAMSTSLSGSTASLVVGCLSTIGTQYYAGYLDELRLSVGLAHWTDNFAPPTAPYDS